jgi:hypothetical protein
MVWFSGARFYKISQGFKWSTSLDSFVNKRVIANILFMTKRSSLYHSKTGPFGPVFEWSGSHLVLAIQKPDQIVRFFNVLQA